MKKNILIITLIFTVILGIAIVIFVSNENTKENTSNNVTIPQEQKSLINSDLPNVAIKSSNNEEKKLSDFRNGKPTFIIYWASWCSDCRKQLPDVEKLYKEYKDKVNFVFVNVVDGERENVKQAKAYIKESNFTFDYYKSTDNAIDVMKVKKIPTKFIADKNGKIKEVQVEKYVAYEKLKTTLDKLL